MAESNSSILQSSPSIISNQYADFCNQIPFFMRIRRREPESIYYVLIHINTDIQNIHLIDTNFQVMMQVPETN